MYGSSGKLGRGGGGGGRGGAGRVRNTHSSLRPSTAVGWSSSMTGAGCVPRNRTVSPLVPSVSTPSTAAATEEMYSLITSNPLNFAMTIRLAPNLVEEIKRAEAQGGVARIKFDGNTNNPVGNIISVGGKEFRFTWSPETGDLCDIYEERQSGGEDSTGVLVESGSAWRKLNVQRVLDESTKNHVKLRSEEAERKNKSRKAIVLDHRNPYTKSQFKALAAAESNPCRNFKTRKEQPPAKKRKVESISGPPKSVQKSGSLGTAHTKGRTPTSLLVFPPEPLGAPTSPFGSVNITKGHTKKEISTQVVSQTTDYDKDIGKPLVSSYLTEKPGSRSTKINQASELRTVLISLLKESSLKGMSLKALVKAAKEAIPNSSVRQIKSTVKQIATFKAPNKYFLTSGIDIESLKKPLFEKQSSPKDTPHPSTENEKEHGQQDHSGLTLPMRIDSVESDENIQLKPIPQEEPGALNSDKFDAKMITGNDEGPAISSSDSDSESISLTLSGGSESSSDSDSDNDGTTNNQEIDDEVYIMTSDDDREKCQLQASGSVLPKPLFISEGMENVLHRDIPRPRQIASQFKESHELRVEMGGRSVDTAKEVSGKCHHILTEEHSLKESRKPKANTLADLNDKHKDTSLTGSSDGNQRRREPSFDETSCPYSKYEKDEPQLKGSIRDFSEYEEYVKEYKEKYNIYVSLDKVLESTREDFIKHQREIEAAVKKDPEKYSKLVCQIKESFCQSAERHKRLKKIFIILYEESANLKQKITEFAAPYLKNE